MRQCSRTPHLPCSTQAARSLMRHTTFQRHLASTQRRPRNCTPMALTKPLRRVTPIPLSGRYSDSLFSFRLLSLASGRDSIPRATAIHRVSILNYISRFLGSCHSQNSVLLEKLRYLTKPVLLDETCATRWILCYSMDSVLLDGFCATRCIRPSVLLWIPCYLTKPVLFDKIHATRIATR